MNDLIAGYERHLRELGRADSTIKTYVEDLERLDRVLPVGLESASGDELRDWIYSDTHGNATRKLYRAIACGFFRWATDPEDPHLDFNPTGRLPKVKAPAPQPRAPRDEQVYDILERSRPPHRDWFLIAAVTGARCIEIAALDREHITQSKTWLHGKGDKVRAVPTHPLLWTYAQQLPRGPVAVGADGRRFDRQQISHRGNYVLKRVLGHTDLHMHRLRCWFGTRAYEACNRDIRAVQGLLGHAAVSTTQVYIEISEENQQRAVSGLPVERNAA
jgi:integrase